MKNVIIGTDEFGVFTVSTHLNEAETKLVQSFLKQVEL